MGPWADLSGTPEFATFYNFCQNEVQDKFTGLIAVNLTYHYFGNYMAHFQVIIRYDHYIINFNTVNNFQ